jgi:hypothetical protein
VIFNRNHHLPLRKLIIDASVESLPKQLSLSQVISLELHQESRLDIIEQSLEVRSLKLTGQHEWVIRLLRRVSYVNMKLEQLILDIPGIGSLYDLLASITSLVSLRRLVISANQSEEKIKRDAQSVAPTKIEYFSLHSCSSMSWNELSYIFPALSDIRALDITLLYDNKNSFSWFTFPKLRYICLRLLEVPFEWIVQFVKTMPSLVKLKLNGLIDAEGYIFNYRWVNLFESCSSLQTVIVNVSLERDNNYFCFEMIQTALRKINLNLMCIDDDYEYYSDGRNQHRWWTLSGIITRQHAHI